MTRYSHSRLSTFKTCPLKYKYAYIDKIERPTQGVEAFMGSRVHDVLEKLYTDIKICKINDLDELLELYRKNWDKLWHKDVVIAKKEYSADNYKDLGVECITRFYNRYQPFDQAIVLGTEMNINFSLAEDESKHFRGIIDRLDQKSDGVYEIHDYKTSASLPLQSYLDSDDQLAVYHMALKEKFNDVKSVDLVWHYLAFDKEFRSSRTDEQLDDLRKRLIETINEIELSTEFLPKESALCEWCEYPDLCPKRKHYVKVNALLPEEFNEEKGVALVNKFVLLEAKKKEVKEFLDRVDAEIEGVKKALVDYSLQEGMDVIKGNNKKARVKTDEKLAFPLKNDPRRPRLDKVIKDAGKWEEASDLNPWLLAKLVKDKKWDAELINEVRKFATSSQAVSVYLSNLSPREKVED